MLVDSNLPVDRDRLKNRLIRFVKEDTEIIGCFFSGSIGEKTEDFYSDIDARIVVKDGVALKRKQQEIIRSIGEYLFIEESYEDHSVIHYATFIKLDLFLYRQSELKPSIDRQKIAIVKDDGFLEQMQKESQTLSFKVTQETFDHILHKYYGFYFELYRCLRRGEMNYLESTTLSLKQSLVSMWYLSKGFAPNEVTHWGKYEGARSKLSQLERDFLNTYTPCPVDELESFTKKIELLMLEATEKVAAYHDLDFCIETYRKVHRRVSFKGDVGKREAIEIIDESNSNQ